MACLKFELQINTKTDFYMAILLFKLQKKKMF
jgi:hypothetical protein